MVAAAQKIKALSQILPKDAKKAHKEAAGDLSGVEVMHRYVLVATHVRSEKIGSLGLILRSDTNLQEDEYQSKCALVLKMGNMAFQDVPEEGIVFGGQKAEVGDWIVLRVGDGWPLNVNGTPCRMILDGQVRMKVENPEMIY